jgi:uncharacterized membrane protein
MDDVVLALSLHVLGVVIWIGGVAMITMVVLPAIRRGDLGLNQLHLFEALERRFAWHARLATIIVGLTGLYITNRLGLWYRFHSGEFWWMHAMVCLWLVFAFLLFVAEPFIHRRFETWATTRPDIAFGWLERGHWVLLTLSILTICGAVAGSHGWSVF